MKKKIFLVAGDPNSINSEIIYKSWKKLNKTIKKNLFIIGNYNLISKQFRKLNISKKIIKQQKSILNVNSDELKIIDIPSNKTCQYAINNLTTFYSGIIPV